MNTTKQYIIVAVTILLGTVMFALSLYTKEINAGNYVKPILISLSVSIVIHLVIFKIATKKPT